MYIRDNSSERQVLRLISIGESRNAALTLSRLITTSQLINYAYFESPSPQ
jgi:hypothetical protein